MVSTVLFCSVLCLCSDSLISVSFQISLLTTYLCIATNHIIFRTRSHHETGGLPTMLKFIRRSFASRQRKSQAAASGMVSIAQKPLLIKLKIIISSCFKPREMKFHGIQIIWTSTSFYWTEKPSLFAFWKARRELSWWTKFASIWNSPKLTSLGCSTLTTIMYPTGWNLPRKWRNRSQSGSKRHTLYSSRSSSFPRNRTLSKRNSPNTTFTGS